MSMQYSPYVVAATTMATKQIVRCRRFIANNPHKEVKDFFADPAEAEITYTILTNLAVADEETHISNQI